MPVTIALFDIDGTLLRAGGAGRRALELALGELLGDDTPASFSDVEFAGRTDPWIVAEGLAQHGLAAEQRLVDAVLRRYIEHLPEQLARASAFEVLPGALSLVSRLAGRPDVVLGLGTGNTETAAYAKLARAGLDAYFSFGGFGSDHVERAQLLRVGLERGIAQSGGRTDVRAVVIGDTPHDIRAAKAIGAECVAVATGSFDADALSQAGAKTIVSGLGAAEVFEALT